MFFEWSKAQYLLGEDVCILTDTQPQQVTLFRLHTRIPFPFALYEGMLVLKNVPVGSYGITVTAADCIWESAFDVVNAQSSVTRYGFLSDFGEADGAGADIAWMRSLHLNAVQFYDWMYRHDQLVADTDDYCDPLGRRLSRPVVEAKISACHKSGMRPFAYGAVYAATKETFTAHPEWGVYTLDGQPMVFADWLHFMNIAKDCPWREHLLEQYKAAIAFGFSGIHMDTYGFPKRVWDQCGRPVDLADAFPELICDASAAVHSCDSNGGVIFNAVNNWPTETVAETPQDAVYIEVWPPHDSYAHLYDLITNAAAYGKKPVVLAAYLKAFLSEDTAGAQRSMRLCFAAIAASKGTQLVLGEDCGVLRDSYYVNYAKLQPDFLPCVQKYCDFLVRYADLLYNDKGMDISKTASDGINEDVCFAAEGIRFSADASPDSVWSIIRESRQRTNIQLINLCGNNSLWNEAKAAPKKVDDIRISVRLDRAVAGVFCASPDGEHLNAVALPYTFETGNQGRVYHFTLPRLEYWSAVWLELED